MLRFDEISFAVLGLIAAAIPLIIHLLFRRRFKTVHWAAVTLLREALESKRKTLRLRDLVVLAIRMIAVMALGLTLARPHFQMSSMSNVLMVTIAAVLLLASVATSVVWATSSKIRPVRYSILIIPISASVIAAGLLLAVRSSSSSDTDSAYRARQPIHAVLLIDNSRSMGVESLGRSLLDDAKARSIELIDALPLDSRITVIPMAGSESPISLDAYKNKDEAKRTIERVKLLDVAADPRSALDLAQEACQRTSSPSAKRVMILTDAQKNAWRNIDATELARVPDLQIINLTRTPASNVWITDFQLEDGLASNEVPGRFLARIHSSPLQDRESNRAEDTPFDVHVRLSIDGIEVASQSISLIPGQEREIEFDHEFRTAADPSQPVSIAATIAVQADATVDSLTRDNHQEIVVPIVASFPILFVDQYGDQENLEQDKIGETYALRHLMAPRSATEDSARRLIQVEHLRPDQLTQEQLRSTRLVVTGGIETPAPQFVSLLREFVEQGGPLVILAGGQFNPTAWTEQGWQAGRGVLPVPLDANSIGELPDQATQPIKPFFVSFASMQHDFFLIKNEDEHTLDALFKSTPFFKAVRCELTAELLERILQSECIRLKDDQAFLQRFSDSQRTIDAQLPVSASDQQRFRTLHPTWWNWRRLSRVADEALSIPERAKLTQPRALALFEDQMHPFIVERPIGAGRVIFFTSGVTSNWSLLRNSGAMYLFHRMFCRLMEQTLPRQNFASGKRIVIECDDRGVGQYVVTRPDGTSEPLTLEKHENDWTNITMNHALTAGHYTVSPAQPSSANPQQSDAARKTEQIFAVSGSENESDLAAYSTQELQSLLSDQVLVLNADQPIRIEGSRGVGRDLWKQFGYLLLACCLIETIVLARPWSRALPA